MCRSIWARLEDGQIILVSLARKGGNISSENADLFATLLLSDLWASADERGKDEMSNRFTATLTSFSDSLRRPWPNPWRRPGAIGIGMTFANQFPRQILNGGPFGQRIYDEVMENARNKVVFHLGTRPTLSRSPSRCSWARSTRNR